MSKKIFSILIFIFTMQAAYAAMITIENMTSVQLWHASFAWVLVQNNQYSLAPDTFLTISLPAHVPIFIKLNGVTFDEQAMHADQFLDCEKTLELNDLDAFHMYMVGQVPEGTIECRYYYDA